MLSWMNRWETIYVKMTWFWLFHEHNQVSVLLVLSAWHNSRLSSAMILIFDIESSVIKKRKTLFRERKNRRSEYVYGIFILLLFRSKFRVNGFLYAMILVRWSVYSIYLLSFTERNLAERLKSKNSSFTSVMSSFVIDVRPLTLAACAAGVNNWTA